MKKRGSRQILFETRVKMRQLDKAAAQPLLKSLFFLENRL
jgi:hypothetical protein